MSKHWPIVTFVAQTLALNAANLDKSGFDLKFTVDGHRHNDKRLKGDSGRRTLKKALKEAWPEYKPNKHATTDMAQVFENIFKEWGSVGSPATTLLVLTDAVWSKTKLDTLNKTILDIARLDQRRAGYRHFSIQFIRFGEEGAMKARLQWLDDCLCADHNLRDIIDHCSWRGPVDKMIKGSIEGSLDEQDSVGKPMSYDYDKLVELFNAFNTGKESALSTTGTLFRTPSYASSRRSQEFSTSAWRQLESTPVTSAGDVRETQASGPNKGKIDTLSFPTNTQLRVPFTPSQLILRMHFQIWYNIAHMSSR